MFHLTTDGQVITEFVPLNAGFSNHGFEPGTFHLQSNALPTELPGVSKVFHPVDDPIIECLIIMNLFLHQM